MKHFVLFVVLLLVSLSAAQTLTQGVIALAGTVYAPDGEDVAGTVVVACFVQGSDCDESKTKTVEITESGPSASFNITGLSRENYILFASKDVNRNDAPFEDGDFYALYGPDGNVTPPARNVELKLEILGSTQSATSNESTENTSSSGELEPYTVSGIVLDTKGQPLEGATVRLRQDFVSGTTVVTTGPDGRYKASSSVQNAAASYKIEAYKQVDYNGQTICPRLAMPDPNDYTSFTLDKGAERNFQWQLTGKIGNYDTFFGARIDLWNSYSFSDTTRAVELTLTPTGPLLDGSEGSVIVQEVPLGDGDDDALFDIPIGTYTLQAVLIGHDDSRTPINVATIDNIESYTPEVAIEWQSNDSSCGFGNDSGVEQMFISLDEENPKSLQSQPTEFGSQ
jgi:Carboxypeptidase regulatory-like domain